MNWVDIYGQKHTSTPNICTILMFMCEKKIGDPIRPQKRFHYVLCQM